MSTGDKLWLHSLGPVCLLSHYDILLYHKTTFLEIYVIIGNQIPQIREPLEGYVAGMLTAFLGMVI